MKLQQGNRACAETMKQLGFKRLSSSQWVKDMVKVQIVGHRIINIQSQTKFKQPINHFRSKNHKHNQIARQVVKCLR